MGDNGTSPSLRAAATAARRTEAGRIAQFHKLSWRSPVFSSTALTAGSASLAHAMASRALCHAPTAVALLASLSVLGGVWTKLLFVEHPGPARAVREQHRLLDEPVLNGLLLRPPPQRSLAPHRL